VSLDCLKITTYFGERDRYHGRFLADELIDLFARREFPTSILLRGIEGFGGKHRLQTERLLSLSDDLPLVAIGVAARERAEPVVEELRRGLRGGLVTVEHASLVTGRPGAIALPADLQEAAKLTVYCGRSERIGGRPAATAIVDLLHREGVAGATVFLGVDGTSHGVRQRARFFARNGAVPVMVVSVGTGATVAAALAKLGDLLARPLMTLEPVRVLKRDGAHVAELDHGTPPERPDVPVWQKVTIYAGEQARLDGHALHVELIRRLRRADASGATTLRGVWGYHGDHAPHGDRLLSLRRHVPAVTVIVDRPPEIRRLWPIIDQATAAGGLVTSELVSTLPLSDISGGPASP
jgi:PII-like signaling protein